MQEMMQAQESPNAGATVRPGNPEPSGPADAPGPLSQVETGGREMGPPADAGPMDEGAVNAGCSCNEVHVAPAGGPEAVGGPGAFQGGYTGGPGPMGAFPGQQGMPQSPPYSNPGPAYQHPGSYGPAYQQPGAYGPAPGHNPHVCSHGQAPGRQVPKHDANQYGQFMQLVGDVANGNADPARVMDFLSRMDAQFWKGALVGVGATLLLTNDAAKNAVTGALSGLLGLFGKKTEDEAKPE